MPNVPSDYAKVCGISQGIRIYSRNQNPMSLEQDMPQARIPVDKNVI